MASGAMAIVQSKQPRPIFLKVLAQPQTHLGETGPIRQGAQAGRKALRIRWPCERYGGAQGGGSSEPPEPPIFFSLLVVAALAVAASAPIVAVPAAAVAAATWLVEPFLCDMLVYHLPSCPLNVFSRSR